MKNFLTLFGFLLPWPLRRLWLQLCFGYEIHPTARIGLAWVRPRRLIMEADTVIGTLTICKNLNLIHLKAHACIGRRNWITGFPPGDSRHFAHEMAPRPELILGEHSAITNRHLTDCTSRIEIGRFTTFTGFQSQILTHSINLEHCQQSSAPISIGDYCLIGTNCVLLGGSSLPHYSVLAAKSLLNKPFAEERWLYGGIPVRAIKPLPRDWKDFDRSVGVVD